MSLDNPPANEPAGVVSPTVNPDGAHTCPPGFTLVMTDPDSNGNYHYVCVRDHALGEGIYYGESGPQFDSGGSDEPLHPLVESAIDSLSQCQACVDQCYTDILAGIIGGMQECDAGCCDLCGAVVGSIATKLDTVDAWVTKTHEKILLNIIASLSAAERTLNSFPAAPPPPGQAGRSDPTSYTTPGGCLAYDNDGDGVYESCVTAEGGDVSSEGCDTKPPCSGDGGDGGGDDGGSGDCSGPDSPTVPWVSPAGRTWYVAPGMFTIPLGTDKGQQVPQPYGPMGSPPVQIAYWLPANEYNLPPSYPCYAWANNGISPIVQLDQCGQYWWGVVAANQNLPECSDASGDGCCEVTVNPVINVTGPDPCKLCPKPADVNVETGTGTLLDLVLYNGTGEWEPATQGGQ